eukprot:scaffold910_cov396-Prasinococcus_capsulatus_cf.AAC.78
MPEPGPSRLDCQVGNANMCWLLDLSHGPGPALGLALRGRVRAAAGRTGGALSRFAGEPVLKRAHAAILPGWIGRPATSRRTPTCSRSRVPQSEWARKHEAGSPHKARNTEEGPPRGAH